jgi:signal transduction histidine kinase
MGQAVSGLSHYIKNIVAAMETSHGMMERGLANEDLELIQRVWKILLRSNRRIGNLVLDMLAYSKKRKPEKQPCRINDICREVAEMCQDRIQAKNAQLHLTLEQGLSTIQADVQGMHRCLLNLVTNAIDAISEQGGEIKIGTNKPTENEVKITVTDNGVGIDEKVCDKIFDVFFSTKGSQGTGLGLAVTQKIIEEHNGRIEVSSTPEQCTEFTISLPLEEASPDVS